MASANSRARTFVQASSLNTSLTLLVKAELKNGERARHGFRSIVPWNVPVVDVHVWLQTFKRFVGCDVEDLSVGQMRRFHIRRILVGKDGIQRVLFSEPIGWGKLDRDCRGQRIKGLGLRGNQVVEVVCSFA